MSVLCHEADDRVLATRRINAGTLWARALQELTVLGAFVFRWAGYLVSENVHI